METAPFPAMAGGLPGAGEIPGHLYRGGKQQETSQADLALHTSSSEHPICGKRLCWRALAGGHNSPAPRATGLSKTLAFEGQQGGKAANRGNKQLIWGLSRVQREENKALWSGALLEAGHHQGCCFASSWPSKMSLLCNLNSCWPSCISHIWEDWKILFQRI